MNAAICKIYIRLPENGSLKGKRQVIKSIMARVRNKFNVSIAEVDDHHSWQKATIAFAFVSNDSRYSNEVLSRVVNFITQSRFDIEIVDYETEILSI